MSCQKNSPDARLSKKTDLRIRDIPEWQSALVFDPDQPDLRMINLTSRLILELCDGRLAREIEDQYCSLMRSQVDLKTAREQFSAGLNQLQEHGLTTIAI